MTDTAVREHSALLGTPLAPSSNYEVATLPSMGSAETTRAEAALMVKREKWRSVVTILGPVAFWAFVITIAQVDLKASWTLMLLVFTAAVVVPKFAKPASRYAGFWRRNIGLTTLYFGTVVAGLLLCIPVHLF